MGTDPHFPRETSPVEIWYRPHLRVYEIRRGDQVLATATTEARAQLERRELAALELEQERRLALVEGGA